MVRTLAVVAALAVAMAGCSAVVPTDNGGRPSTTATPAPVPGDTATATPDPSLPPGVYANGSVSPGALGLAHDEELRGQSFTWRVEYERRNRDDGAVVDSVSKRMRVGPDGSYLLRTERSTGERQTVYAGETGTYLRSVFENVSTERELDYEFDHRRHLLTPQSLYRYLPSDSATVTRVRRGDRLFYRVHVTTPPLGVSNRHPKQVVRNYSATAYLTPEGLVRTLAVRYDYRLRGEAVSLSLRTEHRRVGETTVERPDWAAELARASASGSTTTATRSTTESPSGTVTGTTAAANESASATSAGGDG
ncbi:hypothetical protein BRC79_11080 [Halobacteriales archaeon QH_8_67_27]|nr:MAG: hypothetical protein BRC79_11080 [Halobacteriales archaeon QH_8_67_27]